MDSNQWGETIVTWCIVIGVVVLARGHLLYFTLAWFAGWVGLWSAVIVLCGFQIVVQTVRKPAVPMVKIEEVSDES